LWEFGNSDIVIAKVLLVLPWPPLLPHGALCCGLHAAPLGSCASRRFGAPFRPFAFLHELCLFRNGSQRSVCNVSCPGSHGPGCPRQGPQEEVCQSWETSQETQALRRLPKVAYHLECPCQCAGCLECWCDMHPSPWCANVV
jgi:hypothetical protein